MSTTWMQAMSYGAFILSGMAGIGTVIVWLRLDISGVITDLQGKRTRIKRQKDVRKLGENTAEMQKTVALVNEVTTQMNGYYFAIDEVVVHTEERIVL